MGSASGTPPLSLGIDGSGNLTGSVAAATDSVNGYMLAADKAKLDAATAVDTVSTIVMRDSNGKSAFTTVEVSSLDDSSNQQVVSLDNQRLYDALGVRSEDWNVRRLYDTLGILSEDWNARDLYDTNAVQSLDYGNRKLYDQNDHLVCWWNSGTSHGGFTVYQTVSSCGCCANLDIPVLDIRVADDVWVCNDFAELLSVDVENRLLVDTNGLTVVDWQNHWFAPKTKRTIVYDSDYTALNTDTFIAYPTLTASRVITLLSPANMKFDLEVKDESGNCASGKTITLTPPGGITIDGASSLVLNSAYAKATIYTDGSTYFTR